MHILEFASGRFSMAIDSNTNLRLGRSFVRKHKFSTISAGIIGLALITDLTLRFNHTKGLEGGSTSC